MANLRSGGNAILYTVLVIGSVIFLNVISSRVFGRVDLTEDQVYTLSDASKKLVGSLPDRLTVKAFISGELPPHPQIKALERYTRDMLAEYAAHSKGKMVWEALDPDADPKVKEEAQRLKVNSHPLAVFQQTKQSVAQAYLGVAFQHKGKVETIPFVTDMADLEYQISAIIRRLITAKKKRVGFTAGHGEPPTTRGLAAAAKQLQDYDVTTVDLAEGKQPIPADLDLLLVVGPTTRFAERAKYELDQFLQRGKSVALFLDGMVLETPRGQFGGQTPPQVARANDLGLAAQLEHYGVKVNQDLVMDRQNQRVRVRAGQNQIVVTHYPAFPVVTNLDRESPITRKLKGFIAVFPSSVQLTAEARDGKSGVTGEVLANSSSASWRQTGFFLFDPLRQPQPTKELGPFPLGVALRGSFRSFFDGKPVPPPGPPASDNAADKPPAKSEKRSPSAARLVVFGDADLIKDQFLPLSQGQNLALLANVVDFLAQDDSLVGIRTKGQTRRPLENLDEGTATTAKVVNIVGLPLAFIALGVLRWRWRRGRRRRLAEELLKGA